MPATLTAPFARGAGGADGDGGWVQKQPPVGGEGEHVPMDGRVREGGKEVIACARKE